MKGLDLGVGAEVAWNGRRFVITNDAVSFGEVDARDTATGRFERLPVAELTEPHEDVATVGASDLASIESHRFEEARRRQVVLEKLAALPDRSVDDVRRAAGEYGVNLSTMYRWLRLYRLDDRLTTLLPHRPNGGRGKGRLAPEVERAIETALERHLTPQQLSASATAREVQRLCRAAGVKPPSFNTILARIDAIPEPARLRKRGHKKDASDRFEPKPGHFSDATQPLEIVQIDHTQLDIILVDEEHRLPLRRPWVTVAVDVYSRMVLGFYVSFDAPGTHGTGLCIAHAILPKERWLARYNIKAEWPCWGFPSRLHADNAREFRGETLRRACEQYGITTEFRPIKTPEYGGHIERLLGTFARRIHELPGAAPHPRKRAEYDSETEAALTLQELEEYLIVFITSVYHQEFHTGINCSPIARWKRAILGDDKHPGAGLFPRPKDEERLRIDFMPIEERTIQNYGVTIDCVHYYSDVLRPYVRQKRNGSSRFTFRRDPRDISAVYFWDPDLGHYAQVPYRNITHPPMSVWELTAIRRRLEEEGRTGIDEDTIFEAYERLRRHEEAAKAATKAVRRKAERTKLLKRERVHREKPSKGAPAGEPRATSFPAQELEAEKKCERPPLFYREPAFLEMDEM